MKQPLLVRRSPSAGAKVLAESLGIKRVSPDSPHLNNRVLINWGCTQLKEPYDILLTFNGPGNVRLASDKLNCALTLEEASVRTVNFFTGTYSEVRAKFPDEILVARHTLTGSCGKGIQILRPGDPPPEREAKAYCPYVKKLTEFRVHVAFGKVIRVVEKRKRKDAAPTADEKLIRNVGDTWVFCEKDLSCDERNDRTQLHKIALDAIDAVGLDFGAVDVLYSKDGEYVVCEINTKPGIASTATLEAYVNAFANQE